MDILISEDLRSPALSQLEAKYQVVREASLWQQHARLKESIAQARTIVIRNQTRLTAELLAAAPHLMAIGRVGVGLDNIDMAAASKLGIVVVAPLNANATSVAELTCGLLLALARKIPQADRSTRAGDWDRAGCTGIEVEGKTLALCGFGRIGRLVASRARAFGLNIAVYDPLIAADSVALSETGATLHAQLETALAGADFVSLHLPLTQDTAHSFNAKTFNAFKPGAFFINTSRGGVVDEPALLAALQTGRLAGAALDVREVEPPAARDSFAALPNVILTPHIGAFTLEAQKRTFETVAADLERLLSGQPALSFVNLDRPKR